MKKKTKILVTIAAMISILSMVGCGSAAGTQETSAVSENTAVSQAAEKSTAVSQTAEKSKAEDLEAEEEEVETEEAKEDAAETAESSNILEGITEIEEAYQMETLSGYLHIGLAKDNVYLESIPSAELKNAGFWGMTEDGLLALYGNYTTYYYTKLPGEENYIVELGNTQDAAASSIKLTKGTTIEDCEFDVDFTVMHYTVTFKDGEVVTSDGTNEFKYSFTSDERLDGVYVCKLQDDKNSVYVVDFNTGRLFISILQGSAYELFDKEYAVDAFLTKGEGAEEEYAAAKAKYEEEFKEVKDQISTEEQ